MESVVPTVTPLPLTLEVDCPKALSDASLL
jgi:hypothetical protein